MEWPHTATWLFRFYNFLDARFANHSILTTKAIDLNASEAKIPKIFLAAEIKSVSLGPKALGNRRCQKEQVVIPPVFASIFSDVIINPNTTAIYDPDQKRIFLQRIHHPDEDKFCYHQKCLAAFNGNFGILRFPKQVEKIPCGIFLAGTGCSNYYHYLLEFISKTEYIPQLGSQYREYPLLVHQNVEGNHNLHEFLKLANHLSLKVIFLSEENAYQVASLIQISHVSEAPFNLRGITRFKASYFYTRPSTVVYLRNLVLAKAVKKNRYKRGPKKFFLSRRQVKRRTYNQDEVAAIARKHGFEEIHLEEYDIYEQAYLVNQAHLIVGPAGAAWSNLLFARQGARGLSWMSETAGDVAVFSNIAAVVGFELLYIRFPDTGTKLHESYYLNPENFEDALIRLCKGDCQP